MRSLTPLTAIAVTITFLVAVPTLIPNPTGGRAIPTTTPECVTAVQPPTRGASGAFGITDGPGGVWFSHGATIDRVDSRGGIQEFALPDPATANAGTLAWKSGEPVWFADRGNGRIGSVDRRGKITAYDVPRQLGTISVPQGIVIGPGSHVWFTDQTGNAITRLDSSHGTFTSFPVPTPDSSPVGIVRGPDDALWFTERTADKIGRLAPDGTFTEWALTPGAFPNRITVGPDDAIWFTELNTSRIGRIGADGQLAEYPIDGGPVGISAGPGKSLYVSLFHDGAVVQIDTAARVIGRWDLGAADGPLQLAVANRDVWTVDPFTDTVYRVRPACRPPAISSQTSARFQAVLDQALPVNGPGCSAALGENGRAVWTGVRGFADVPRGTPITPDTIFDIGSISKHFTAVAVLLLAQEGRLSLDSTLSDHLDGFPEWAATVTVRNMIYQRSGIPEYIELFDAKGYWRTDHVTQQQTIDELRSVTALRFPAGSQWEYSNSNYVLLADIVHAVTGTELPTFLRRNIFKPLSLQMRMDAVHPIPGRAVNYETLDGVLQANDNERWEQIGDGAVQTTPSQMVAWADNFRTGRVGGPALISAQVDDAIEVFPGGVRYGAGLFVAPDSAIGHPGDWLGFVNTFIISPDRTRAVAVSCNSWDIDVNAIGAQFTQIWIREQSR